VYESKTSGPLRGPYRVWHGVLIFLLCATSKHLLIIDEEALAAVCFFTLCHVGASYASAPLRQWADRRSEAVLQGLTSSFQLKLSTNRFVQSKIRGRQALADPWAYHIAKGSWLLRHSQGARRRRHAALISTMIAAHLRYCAISSQLDARAIGLQSSAWGAMLTRLGFRR